MDSKSLEQLRQKVMKRDEQVRKRCERRWQKIFKDFEFDRDASQCVPLERVFEALPVSKTLVKHEMEVGGDIKVLGVSVIVNVDKIEDVLSLLNKAAPPRFRKRGGGRSMQCECVLSQESKAGSVRKDGTTRNAVLPGTLCPARAYIRSCEGVGVVACIYLVHNHMLDDVNGRLFQSPRETMPTDVEEEFRARVIDRRIRDVSEIDPFLVDQGCMSHSMSLIAKRIFKQLRDLSKDAEMEKKSEMEQYRSTCQEGEEFPDYFSFLEDVHASLSEEDIKDLPGELTFTIPTEDELRATKTAGWTYELAVPVSGHKLGAEFVTQERHNMCENFAVVHPQNPDVFHRSEFDVTAVGVDGRLTLDVLLEWDDNGNLKSVYPFSRFDHGVAKEVEMKWDTSVSQLTLSKAMLDALVVNRLDVGVLNTVLNDPWKLDGGAQDDLDSLVLLLKKRRFRTEFRQGTDIVEYLAERFHDTLVFRNKEALTFIGLLARSVQALDPRTKYVEGKTTRLTHLRMPFGPDPTFDQRLSARLTQRCISAMQSKQLRIFRREDEVEKAVIISYVYIFKNEKEDWGHMQQTPEQIALGAQYKVVWVMDGTYGDARVPQLRLVSHAGQTKTRQSARGEEHIFLFAQGMISSESGGAIGMGLECVASVCHVFGMKEQDTLKGVMIDLSRAEWSALANVLPGVGYYHCGFHADRIKGTSEVKKALRTMWKAQDFKSLEKMKRKVESIIPKDPSNSGITKQLHHCATLCIVMNPHMPVWTSGAVEGSNNGFRILLDKCRMDLSGSSFVRKSSQAVYLMLEKFSSKMIVHVKQGVGLANRATREWTKLSPSLGKALLDVCASRPSATYKAIEQRLQKCMDYLKQDGSNTVQVQPSSSRIDHCTQSWILYLGRKPQYVLWLDHRGLAYCSCPDKFIVCKHLLVAAHLNVLSVESFRWHNVSLMSPERKYDERRNAGVNEEAPPTELSQSVTAESTSPMDVSAPSMEAPVIIDHMPEPEPEEIGLLEAMIPWKEKPTKAWKAILGHMHSIAAETRTMSSDIETVGRDQQYLRSVHLRALKEAESTALLLKEQLSAIVVGMGAQGKSSSNYGAVRMRSRKEKRRVANLAQASRKRKKRKKRM